jgi:hypothetical protein
MAPVAASAQSYSYGIEGIERYMRVETTTGQGKKGPIVYGYVHNLYGNPLDRVRLVLEILDASGKPTSSTIISVLGIVPVGGRGYFETPAPPAGTNYRVRGLSFDPVGRGGA